MTTRTEWADFFDGHAPIYEDNCFTKNTIAEVDFLVEELGLASGSTIVDVGCGTGRHSIELARRGHAVTGVDVSSQMLARARIRAREAGVTVTWIEANATEFRLDAPCDAAICLCEGAFGLLGSSDDAIGQPRAVLERVAAAIRPGAPCLFTVLNGLAIIRRHGRDSVVDGRFDPLTLAEVSECSTVERPLPLRERGFVPTEIVLLFGAAGLCVRSIWGGTAGQWGRRPIDPDEIELMVVARRA